MNKKPILFVAGILLAVTALASSTGKTQEETKDILIRLEDPQESANRPRTSDYSFFYGYLETDYYILSIYTNSNVGEISTHIENLSTGEYYEYSFDSSEIAVLPISCTEGFWRITLTLDSGAVYVGEFEI